MPLNKLSLKDIRPDRIIKKLNQLFKFCKSYHSPFTFNYYLSLIYYLRFRTREGFRHDEIFSQVYYHLRQQMKEPTNTSVRGNLIKYSVH